MNFVFYLYALIHTVVSVWRKLRLQFLRKGNKFDTCAIIDKVVLLQEFFFVKNKKKIGQAYRIVDL